MKRKRRRFTFEGEEIDRFEKVNDEIVIPTIPIDLEEHYFIEFLSFETREWMKREEEIKFRNSRRRMQITD